MATTASTSTPATAQAHPHKSSGKRVFRSISRFLSGGGSTTKQRPKLPHHDPSSKDGVTTTRTRTESPHRRSSSRSSSRSRRTNDDDDDREGLHRHDPSQRTRGHSVSARSALSGADTDASIYAMSPSTRGPSSIVSSRTVDSSSHDASSLAPTHKSYASTKPTTLLSVDLGGAPGANRIAVVPGTGVGASGTGPGFLGASAGSAGSHGLSFSSSLPATSSPTLAAPIPTWAAATAPFAAALHTQHRHRPSSSSTSSSRSLVYLPDGTSLDLPDSPTGVPSHTYAHPRNNPHPAFPPADNASVLTLASSSFAPSVMNSGGASVVGDKAGAAAGARSSWTSAGGLRAWSTRQARSLHGGGGSGAKSLLGAAQGAEADEDASVRALAGSRRASDESLGSRSTWSAVVSAGVGPGAGGVGTGGRHREGSVRSRAPLEDGEAATSGGGERDPKERRASMRTLETAPSIVLPVGNLDARHDGDGFESVANDGVPVAAHTPEEKGKSVDAAEHVGIAPTLAETAQTFGLPVGGDILAASAVSDSASGAGREGGEATTEASTPRGEKGEGEAFGLGSAADDEEGKEATA
ncbi:hypothetical protein JCM8208_003548 [Rhodotorula glutinis]